MGYIEDQAAKAGYQLRVDGASKVSLWPNLNVSASDIRLSDPDDPRDNLLTAKELRIGISLLSLLTGDVRIHEIEVTRPVVRLTSGRRGSRVAGRRETREDSARNIAIDRLSVVDGTLIMRDLRENLEGRLDAIQLTASLPTGRSTSSSTARRATSCCGSPRRQFVAPDHRRTPHSGGGNDRASRHRQEAAVAHRKFPRDRSGHRHRRHPGPAVLRSRQRRGGDRHVGRSPPPTQI